MTPDLATFRALFPEFAAVPDATVEVYLDMNGEGLSAAAWGRCYAKAVLYYSAHELSLALQREQSAAENGGIADAGGVLQAGHEEGIAFTFAKRASSDATDEWLALTPYGQAYAALKRQCLNASRLSW